MDEPTSQSDLGPHDWRSLRELLEDRSGMESSPAIEAARALRASFELHARGIRMMRMQLRREDPQAPEAVRARRLRCWLSERIGAHCGDGVGRSAPERLARILGGAS